MARGNPKPGGVALFLRVGLTGAVARLPVISCGKALVMSKRIAGPHKPIDLSRVTEISGLMSKGGQFVGQSVRRRGVQTNVAFKNLDPDWYRTYLDPFAEFASTTPYFFAWNPLGYPKEVGYVQTKQDISPVYNEILNLMDVSWDMEGNG